MKSDFPVDLKIVFIMLCVCVCLFLKRSITYTLKSAQVIRVQLDA